MDTSQQDNKSVESANILTPYKTDKFELFLEVLGERHIESWVEVAQAVGVAMSTIQIWKEDPRAKAAQVRGLKKALKMMETVGKDDWRMWREMAKIRGVKDVQSVEHTGSVESVIRKLEESDYSEYSEQVAKQSVANVTSIQDQGQTGQSSDIPSEPDASAPHTGEGQPQEESNSQG